MSLRGKDRGTGRHSEIKRKRDRIKVEEKESEREGEREGEREREREREREKVDALFRLTHPVTCEWCDSRPMFLSRLDIL